MSLSSLEWERLNKSLNDLWEGPLENFRYRKFLQDDFDVVVKVLSSIDISEENVLDKGFVSLLWFIPQFMEWQQEGTDTIVPSSQDYANLCNWANDRVMNILGGP
jgi:hypothetical protein